MTRFAIHLQIDPAAAEDGKPWVVCAAEPGENQDLDRRVLITACAAAASMVVSRCLSADKDHPGLPAQQLIDKLVEDGLIPRDIIKPEDLKPAKKAKKEARKEESRKAKLAKKVKRLTSVSEELLHEARRMIESPDPAIRKAGVELRDRIYRECDPLDPPEVKNGGRE